MSDLLSNLALLEKVIAVGMMVPLVDPTDHKGGSPQNPDIRWGVPLNLTGDVGIGKSQRVSAAAHGTGLPFRKTYPAHRLPEDFGGVAMPVRQEDGSSKLVIECILPQARDLMSLGHGILFLDEISTARPAVQAVALGVSDERRVGDHYLGNKVRVITAMNPPEYAAGGHALSAPLANRLVHIPVKTPSPDEWVAWLYGKSLGSTGTIPVQQLEALITQNWHECWTRAIGLVSGFVRSVALQGREEHHTTLHARPDDGSDSAGGPWPSPRTWFMAACCLATAQALGQPMSVSDTLLAGCVGEDMLPAWTEWVSKANIPDPVDVLTGKWAPPAHGRLDVVQTAVDGACTYLVGHSDEDFQRRYAAGLWLVLAQLWERNKDIVIPVTQRLARAGLDDSNSDKNSAAAAANLMMVMSDHLAQLS